MKRREADVEKSNIFQDLTNGKKCSWLPLDRFCYSEISASLQGRTCPVCQSAGCVMIMESTLNKNNMPDTEVKNIMFFKQRWPTNVPT